MKIKNIIWAMLLVTSGFSACKKDDDNPKTTDKAAANIKQGNWRVTLFKEDATDETQHFSGYTFTFQADGKAVAVKNSVTTNGTWSTGTDDSQDKLYLDFGQTQPLDELTDDWHIIETTATKIRLEDVSGGNGGTDLLTLEKN